MVPFITVVLEADPGLIYRLVTCPGSQAEEVAVESGSREVSSGDCYLNTVYTMLCPG